jgi:hypothetical protein
VDLPTERDQPGAQIQAGHLARRPYAGAILGRGERATGRHRGVAHGREAVVPEKHLVDVAMEPGLPARERDPAAPHRRPRVRRPAWLRNAATALAAGRQVDDAYAAVDADSRRISYDGIVRNPRQRENVATARPRASVPTSTSNGRCRPRTSSCVVGPSCHANSRNAAPRFALQTIQPPCAAIGA